MIIPGIISNFAATMEYSSTNWEDLHVSVQLASYNKGDVKEHHAIIHVEPHGELYPMQLAHILEAELRIKRLLPKARVVLKRYFVSDSTNQAPLLLNEEHEGSMSIIQQPPLDGSKIAAWIYYAEGVVVKEENSFTVCEHNGYKHLWLMGLHDNKGTSAEQTTSLLTRYEKTLALQGATLAENCIRTWFYVRDVDTQYQGLVTARKENFIAQGLTPSTHYISSTGIQGLPADTKSIIQLGTYAIVGLEPKQQYYVKALTHLNPTIEYGVTFERGTVIEYGDRAHCYISGTASINNKGEVVHTGDIVRQTQRMWENVEKLLEEGRFCRDNIAQIIVYLRDTGDYDVVNCMFKERFPNTPYVITLAPVCRPEWLIEMECIAIAERNLPEYREF